MLLSCFVCCCSALVVLSVALFIVVFVDRVGCCVLLVSLFVVCLVCDVRGCLPSSCTLFVVRCLLLSVCCC